MEDQGQIRSEQPTQRRREQSREQGRVAFSSELNNGVVLLIGVVAITLGSKWLGRGIVDTSRGFLLQLRTVTSMEAAQVDLLWLLTHALGIVGFLFAAIFVGGFAISVVQARGIVVSPQAIAFKWEKLSPFEGWKRIISMEGLARAVISMVKVIVIVSISLAIIWNRGPELGSLAHGELERSIGVSWNLASQLLIFVAIALIVIGAADYGFQYWRHEQSLMMTRQELKDEQKTDEGDPQIRARRRAIARQAVGQRQMLEEVPESTVVITNPTHFAVALRYEREEMDAPKVVARGAGVIAARIRELAKEHSIPIVERPALARTLHDSVQAGDEIPYTLYFAVSEVLAYIYRLRGEV